METAYSDDVTISIPNDPGFTATAQATNGVAEFVGLTLGTSACGESIRATAGDLSAAVTGQLNVIAAASPPTIVSERVVMLQKKNKKGKPVGKPVMAGFALVYSTAMNPALTGLASNYQMDTISKKRVKKKTVSVLKPVAFTAAYNTATDTVALLDQRETEFRQGGRDPGDGIGPRWCRKRSRTAARFKRHELQHPSQGEGDRTDPLKEFGQRKARDLNPHFPKENRVSSAARPTVSGYLPIL